MERSLPADELAFTGWTSASRVVWSLGRTSRQREGAQLLAERARKVHATGKEFADDTSARYELAIWQAIANLAGVSDEVDAELRFADPQLALGKERSRRTYATILRADAGLRTPLDGAESSGKLADFWRMQVRGELKPEHFAAILQVFRDEDDPPIRLSAVRLMQLALGDVSVEPRPDDVFAGYSANVSEESLATVRKEQGALLADQFPTFDEDLNLELARLLGMLEVSSSALLDRETTFFSQEYLPSETAIHYLICLSRSPENRSKGASRRTATGLFKAFDVSGAISRNWPLRMGEVISALYKDDPQLASLVAADTRLNSPSHSLLVARMTQDLRPTATRRLLRQAGKSIQWSDELVRLVGELPEDEALHHLRVSWLDTAVRESIILAAAKYHHAKDFTMFFEGLSSAQPEVAEASARAMRQIGYKPSDAELAAAFSALRQHCLVIESKAARESILELLKTWTGENFQVSEPKEQKKLLAAYKPSFDWLAKEHPIVARRVAGFGDATAEEWLARLKKVQWTSGDEQRGLAVFQKKSCHKCHAGNSPLGPSLAGAANRFSREDLFGSILDPHKEVAPPYQTTQIATSSGKVYSGLIVYESPDGTLLQTTPDTTIRIAGDEILSMKKGRVSLMPSGLLNDVSDQDLADLYAYLKSVKSVK
jgi:putative heme-binding domain-containing protein